MTGVVQVEDLPAPPPGRTGWPWTRPPGHGPVRAVERSVTVVTPSYNQASFLEATLRSVLLQGLTDLELLVLDGGSQDGSVEIIDKYSPWISWWCTGPDGGQTEALNRGFRRATREWVGWLNSDDVYAADGLAGLFASLETNPDCTWLVGTCLVTDELLKPQWVFEPHHGDGPWRHADYLGGSWVDFVCTKQSGTALPQPSSLWTRAAAASAGELNPSLRYVMDHDYWIRLSRAGHRPCVVRHDVALHRTHAAQKTAEGRAPFWREELDVLHHWLPLAAPDEQQVLRRYASWLQAEIAREQQPVAATQRLWRRLRAAIARRSTGVGLRVPD